MTGKWERDHQGNHHYNDQTPIQIATEIDLDRPLVYEHRVADGTTKVRKISGAWTFRIRVGAKAGLGTGPWLCREAMGNGGTFQETKRLARAKAKALARELAQELIEGQR